MNSNDMMDPSERIKRYGIECVGPYGDGILFAASEWKPGGEYVQKLIVRNVTTSVKKLKYKLPSTRYFSLAYPEVIILSPGMFQELDVVFRPVVYDPYDDFILFKMIDGEGRFRVPVRALISKLQISTPFGVDLGFCPTHQITRQSFQLENIGEIDAPYRWETPYPFKLSPSEGIIPVGHKHDIEITIEPQDASVYVSEVQCFVGENVHAIIPNPIIVTRISAIAKYPFLSLSEAKIEFGEVLSGSPPDLITKEIILRNPTVVFTEFSCIRVDNDTEEVFHIHPRAGQIPPYGELPIRINYTPLASGVFSQDIYQFQTPSHSSTSLTLSGTSMPPKIILEKELLPEFAAGVAAGVDPELLGSPLNSINFRDTEVNQIETRLFFLKNKSNLPVAYTILNDQEGTFRIIPHQGTISAMMDTPLKIFFSPSRPINYYRRIFILIGDSLPLFVDVMGTGFIRAKGEIKEQRPAPLRHAHIQAYRNRCVGGFGELNPDELDSMKESSMSSEYFARVGLQGTRPLAVTLLKNPLTRTGEASRIDIAVAHELFIPDTQPLCRGIVVDMTEIDFGFTPYQTTSQPRTVSITNKTNGKVVIMWFPPKVHDPASSSSSINSHADDRNAGAPVFSVDPPMSEISPGMTMKYKVTFHPFQSNRNFFSEIEVIGFFKNQRTFRLVNDATLTPPWTLTVKATGHTFSTGQLLAKVTVKSGGIRNGKLIFPVCYVGDAVFQTIKLMNQSNLPCIYQIRLGFQDEPSSSNSTAENGIISIKPSSGEIAANDFTLICIKFTPKAFKKYLQLVRCLINGSPGGQFLIEGTGGLPQLTCPDLSPTYPIGTILSDKKLYNEQFFVLNPTCIGLHTSREFTVKNSSRIPLRFICSLPPQYEKILTVTPSSGFLKGNTELQLIINFKPVKSMKIICKLTIETYPIGGVPSPIIDCRQPGSVAQVQRLSKIKVNILAEGTMGAILFHPEELYTDVKLVNTSEPMDVVLENISDSILQYELYYSMIFQPEPGSISTQSITYPLQLIKKISPSIEKYPEDHQNLSCDEPSGLLPIKSLTKLHFIFQPNRAGVFQFILSCKLKSLDQDGKPVMIGNEDCLVLHHQATGNQESTTSDSILPLTMKIIGRATFPTITFEDIRPDSDVLVNDIACLWKQFSLAEINTELQLPLTDEEVYFNTISSPNLTQLKRFQFQFTPNLLGSPCQVISLQIRNSGFLTTSFKFNLPNEKDLDLEQWCDEEELTEERLTQISILEELKCFTLEPREGTLSPGQSLILTVTYSHTSLKYSGYHKLPIHLRLNQGKQFWIDFIGITLVNDLFHMTTSNALSPTLPQPPSGTGTVNPPRPLTSGEKPLTTLLFLPTSQQNIYLLNSIPIGLPLGEIPLQRIEIFNVCGVDVVYDLDLSSIRHLNKDNFDHEIFKVLNPKGTIPSRSSIFLECLFHPIAAILYSFQMVVKYYPQAMDTVSSPAATSRRKSMKEGLGYLNQIKYLQFSINCEGYDPRQPRATTTPNALIGGIPPKKLLIEMKTICSLSHDCIQLGIIPKCLSTSQMVVLRNHTNYDVEYAIDDDNYLFDVGILSIIPNKGVIAVGEVVVLKINLTANIQPLIIQNRLKIFVNTIFKSAVKRNVGSRHDKLKDRIKNRSRVGTSQKPDIIQSQTFSRSQYMSNMSFHDQSRQATYPSSLSRSASGLTSAGGSNNPPGTPLSVSASDLYENNSRGGPSSVYSKGTTPSSSFLDLASATGSGESSVKGMLKGPTEVIILRLEGEIYSTEVIADLFEKGPQKGILDEFVAPLKMPFIPPRIKLTLPGNGTGRLAGTSTLMMTQSSRSSSPATEERQVSRSRPIPISERQHEVRNVVDSILTSIFKDVLNSRDSQEQLIRAITKPVRGLEMPPGSMKPVGGAVYGVYFQEVVPSLGLSFKLINEIKYLKCRVTGEGHSDLKILKSDFRQILLNQFGFTRKSQTFKEILSIMESTRTDSILFRDLIPSLSDSAAHVLEKKLDGLASDRVLKSKLERKISMPTSIENDVASSTPTPLLDSARVDTDHHGNISHRSTFFSNLQGGSISSNPIFRDKPSTIPSSSSSVPPTKDPKISMIPPSTKPFAVTKKPTLGLRQRTVAMLDHPQIDEVENMTEAAKKIQNLARGNRDRALGQKKREDVLNSRAITALAQGEFISVASTMLADTMFNLMQEVVYGEFIIDAEPIKFVMKAEVDEELAQEEE